MARNLEMRFPFKVKRASPRGAWDAGLGGAKPLIIATESKCSGSNIINSSNNSSSRWLPAWVSIGCNLFWIALCQHIQKEGVSAAVGANGLSLDVSCMPRF